ACLRKEQPWQALSGIEPHQPAARQTRRDRRELWLAGLRSTAPGFELKARRNARKRREETVQFAADVLPLARREGHDRDTLRLAHAPHISTFGCPAPSPGRRTHARGRAWQPPLAARAPGAASPRAASAPEARYRQGRGSA